MKKILFALLLAGLVLVSCDDGKATKNTQDTKAETAAVSVTEAEAKTEAVLANSAPFTVEFDDGKEVTLGADPSEVLPALGDYTDVMEAPSCVHEGSDKVYSYNGFSVMTSPDANGNEYVAQVEFTLDICTLSNGIAVGSSRDDVVAKYGDSFTEQFGMLTYEFEGAVMTVNIQNDIVAGIVFTAK